MTLINDPDNLDRFQVIIDPLYKIISLRGSGGPITGGNIAASDGSGTPGGAFIDSTNNFANVSEGDILAVVNDPNDNGGVMGHYKISQVVNSSGLLLDRSIAQTGGSGVSYKVYQDGAALLTDGPSLASGVTMQALYSFLKEEWRDNSLGPSGEDLIRYTFPMVSITSEQFELGGVSNSNWEFADDTGDGALAAESSRNLIRTGGWASINDAGQIIENYPSIVTLGNIELGSQVYYQLTSATTNPRDFVLEGAVNQSIRTLETIGGVSTTGNKAPTSGITQSLTFTGATKNISAGVDLYALGFTSGELIQVRGANNAANNGLFKITASGTGATSVTVGEASIVDETSPATTKASPMTDNRDYLVLRVRTKGQTYADSEIADIGVTQINTIVNRFPLAESADPAIVVDDGVIQGDGTTGDGSNVEFQSVAQIATGDTDGSVATVALSGDIFTLTSAGSTFQTDALYAGDTVEITAPVADGNIGVYEIKSIDSETQLALFKEPGRTVSTANNGSIAFTTRSRVRDDLGSQAGTLTDTASEVANDGKITLNDASAFGNALVGDIVKIEAATVDIVGFYVVSDVTDASNIKINVKGTNSDDADAPYDSDIAGTNPFIGLSASAVTYTLLQKGMHLGYKKITATEVTGVSASANVLTSAAGELQKADGYYVGTYVTISGTTNSTDGTYLITATTDDNDITIAAIDDPGTAVTIAGSSITVNGTTGYVRKIGDYEYSFNWKLYGNGGSLSQCFQKLQRELRRTTDIDEFDDDVNGIFRGDITDLLMTFASPNGTTLNLFIDQLSNTEANNITFQDAFGQDQNNPFLVALQIAVNDNILNAATNKVVVFFTDNDGTPGNGDEFGSTGAVIVPTSAGGQMIAEDFTTVNGSGSPISFQYNYSTLNVDKPITIVCISDTTGQYVSTTSTLVEENVVNASLVAGLERNYSNP